MMLPEPELTQDQNMGTAAMESVTAPKAENQEAEEPLLTVQTDQSQAEPPLVTPPSRRLSLVNTPPPSPFPPPSDQLEREG